LNSVPERGLNDAGLIHVKVDPPLANLSRDPPDNVLRKNMKLTE